MSNPFTVLWNLMQGQRLRYGAALLCLVLATAANYLVPLVGAATIDHAIGNRPVAEASPLVAALLHAVGGAARLGEQLWLAPVLMVLLTAAGGACSYLKGRYTSLASDGIARRLKDDLYDHLNHLPARTLDRSDTGDLVQRCTSDVETTRQFLAVQVMEIGNALILAATALPLLLLLSPPMTLVAFALIPPLVIYGYVYFRKVRHVFKAVDEAEGALTSVIQENLTGIRVVRAFSRQDFERDQVRRAPTPRYRDRNLRTAAAHVVVLVRQRPGRAVSQLGLILMVGAELGRRQGTLTVGMLFAFLAYLGIMLWPVRQMGRILTDLGKTSVALTRIREILAVAREAEPVGAPPPPSARGSISPAPRPSPAASAVARTCIGGRPHLRPHAANTDLPVDGRGALNGISFEVRPGRDARHAGDPSGGGKSTLMHLLLAALRLHAGLDPVRRSRALLAPAQAGCAARSASSCRSRSSSRNPSATISASAAATPPIGRSRRPPAPPASTTLSSRSSTATNTLIGERGITLSGGQRQRVAIARAILKQSAAAHPRRRHERHRCRDRDTHPRRSQASAAAAPPRSSSPTGSRPSPTPTA
jgi:ATP-binding cassette subfamily B protein